MDWLGRLLGNVGRFLGSVATAPSRAGQAAGKAVRREVQNAAPVVQREIVRPSANIVRAATPKIDLAKVGRFMIGDPNVNPIAKAQRQIPQALGRTAQFVAPNISKAVAHPSTIYGTKSFQKVAQGKASPQEFLKEIFKVGVPLGLDAANFVGGVGLAGKQGVKAIGGQLLKEAGAYTAGSGANKLIQGETAKNVVRQLPADFAGSLAAQGLGFGAGKLLGKAGSIGANRVASNAPAVRMVVDPQTGKQIRAFAPKVNLKAAQPMAPAKAIAQEVRPPAVKLKNIHPDDQAVMGDIIDYARGVYKPSKAEALRLELDARRIAERYKIRQPETIGEMADVFDSVLTSGTKKPIFQNVPKSALKQDPLEALKIEDRLKSKYPGVDFSVYDNGRTINVSKIVVPKTARNSGIGTKAMQEIISEADRSGKTITLTPSSDYGGSKVRLKEFYKRLGFVENKGRTKDLAISEDMYRLPTNKSQGVRDSLADGLPNPGRKPIISDADPLEALKQEARKYKSAEEFVKAKTNQYHGTLDNNYKLDPNNRLFLTGDSDSASTYAGRRYNQDPEGKVIGYHAKDGKTLDLNDNATREKYVRDVLGQDKQLKKYYDRIPESLRKDYFDTLGWAMKEYEAGRIPKADLDKYTQAQKNYKNISSKDVYANWDKIIARAKKDGYDYIKHTTEDPSAEITFPETVALNPSKSLLDDKQLTDLYNQATKAPKRIASDVGEDILPRATKGKETRGFLKQVQTSASTSPELAQAAKGVSGLYTPKSNAKLLKTARNNISSDIMKAEKIATTARTDEGVATASELIKHYQALGQYDKAVEVAQKAAKNLTEAGRQVQAASLYSRISPEGILRYTQAQIDKVGGKKLSSEVAERLTKMAREVQTMPEGMDKAYAVARLQQEISKQIPTNILKKLTTLRKAGLLTGLRTQAGNAVSNLSHIGLNKVSDLPAAAIDAVASVFTGQRTKVFTTRGLASGGAEGVGKAAKFLKTGVDELGLGASKYDISPVNFKSKTVQKYVDTVFNAMGAADKPYRYAALKNQLYDMAIAEAKNKGLRGPQAGTFIKDFIANPPMEAAQKAAAYAEKSVFGNDTLLSQGATALRNAFENNSPPMAAALDILMPFTKVPSAVITRLFDYTPVGAVKEAMKQIRVGKFDQRMFAQALGEAGTGTGAIALGVALASNGQITGPMPNDQRERDLWALEGKQPNAIRFGDKWYSFNYTSPIGQLLQMGSEVSSAAKEGAGLLAAIEGGVWGGAKAVVDQSFLQGVSGVLEAINDHKRYAEDFAKSNAGSVIPTLIADLAKATDPLQRETNSIAEAVKARIPGLRQGLLPKQDAFGNPLAREGNAAQAMADPFRTTQAKSDPLTAELRRLQDANQGITPNADKRKYIQVGNKKYQLNPEELNSLNSATGQETQKYWNQVTQAQQYAGLSDESKKKTLDNIYTDINVVNKYRTLFERGDREAAQQIYDKMTKAQMAYLQNGQLDVNAYLAKNQPKKPRVKIAKARKPRKVRASRGRKVAVARAKVVRVKTPKIGKVPRVKARKVRLASTSGPKVRAVSPKRSRVRISA